MAQEYTLGANWPRWQKPQCQGMPCRRFVQESCRASHRFVRKRNQLHLQMGLFGLIFHFSWGNHPNSFESASLIVFGPASAKEMRFLSCFLKPHNKDMAKKSGSSWHLASRWTKRLKIWNGMKSCSCFFCRHSWLNNHDLASDLTLRSTCERCASAASTRFRIRTRKDETNLRETERLFGELECL